MKARTAAHYLDTSETTFREWVKQGLIPEGAEVNGNVFWHRQDLDDFADSLRPRSGRASFATVKAL